MLAVVDAGQAMLYDGISVNYLEGACKRSSCKRYNHRRNLLMHVLRAGLCRSKRLRPSEVVDGQKRFLISPALINEFLPQRQHIMEHCLNNKLEQPKKPQETLSGHKAHKWPFLPPDC
jgi:hypothetical protein